VPGPEVISSWFGAGWAGAAAAASAEAEAARWDQEGRRRKVTTTRTVLFGVVDQALAAEVEQEQARESAVRQEQQHAEAEELAELRRPGARRS